MNNVSASSLKTRYLVRVGVLGALGFALMFLDMPLAFIAPPFMKLDLSDVPGLISGFAMGPIYGVLVQLIKNILNLSKTSTGGVGELSNFIVGSSFVLVSSLVYKRDKSMKSALIGVILGVMTMAALAMASNYFVVFPLYAKLMIPMETIINMGKAVNPNIDSLWKMMLLSVLPFNLIKGAVNGLVTFMVYKKVRKYL
ncbi:MAG: ECF transporter S component [Tissierellia bacterium]|nr:ECF transporter S component [Tissierellia bacterium]